MAIPIARFSPAPGIWVDWTEKSVVITGAMELYGSEATPERAESIQRSINTTWTQSFPDGYSIKCQVVVKFRPPGSSASSNAAQIEASKFLFNGPSNVSQFPGMGHKMSLNAREDDAFTWTPGHEFGHVIGMDDRYSEPFVSKLVGTFGFKRENKVSPEYLKNLMAVANGELESRNIRDLADENNPSSFWMNDDKYIRDWLIAHSDDEIRKLSINIKLTAIKILMSGIISFEDVTAIKRICANVPNKSEANEIRERINLLDFTDLGQRTVVEISLSKMP